MNKKIIISLLISVFSIVYIDVSDASLSKNVNIAIVKMEVIEVGFKGDHQITKWGGGAIDSPDGSQPVWKKSGNPDLPACYTKNSTAALFAKFQVSPSITDAISNVQVRAKAGGTVIGTAAGLLISGATLDVGDISGGAPIPGADGVKAVNLTLNWEYSLDGGGSWQQAGTSGTHKIFAVDNVPLESPLYDLALEKITSYVNGDANIGQRLSLGIDGDITYDPSINVSGNPLNLYPSGPAQCSNHAALLRYLSRSAGVDASVIYIWGGCSSTTVDFYKYAGWWGPSFRVIQAAHDNASGNPHFTFHAETDIGGTIYDPSYGNTGLITLSETAPAGVPYTDTINNYPNHSPAASRQTGSGWPPANIHGVSWTCPH